MFYAIFNYMITKTTKIIGILGSGLAGHKSMTKPIMRLRIGMTSQAIAQGHNQNIFSDSDIGSVDATTLELISQHHSDDIKKIKTLNVATASTTAMIQAIYTGRTTTIECIQTDNQTMPYGINPKIDKENSEILWNTLKKQDNRH